MSDIPKSEAIAHLFMAFAKDKFKNEHNIHSIINEKDAKDLGKYVDEMITKIKSDDTKLKNEFVKFIGDKVKGVAQDDINRTFEL